MKGSQLPVGVIHGPKKAVVAPVQPDTARIAVVESVYHQQTGEKPTQTESRFSRLLRTTEQPYSRKVRATHEWLALDCGWVTVAGMVVIVNEEGKFTQTIPTNERRTEALKKVLQLGIATDDLGRALPVARILPGESCRFHPEDVKKLRIRSLSGDTRYTITLFPE